MSAYAIDPKKNQLQNATVVQNASDPVYIPVATTVPISLPIVNKNTNNTDPKSVISSLSYSEVERVFTQVEEEIIPNVILRINNNNNIPASTVSLGSIIVCYY